MTLAVWVLRLVGKGLGAAAQPLLTLMSVRRTDPPSVAAAAGVGGTALAASAGVPGPAVVCPHCGAATPPDPFCAVCGRALPAA